MEKNTRIAHGIIVCEDTPDSMVMLGKEGLYRLEPEEKGSERWRVHFTMGCHKQATQVYERKEFAIYAVIVADRTFKRMFRGYDYSISYDEYIKLNNLNADLDNITEPEVVQGLFFYELEKTIFP